MKAKSSGIKAASAVIHAHPCWYLGMSIRDDGSATDVIANVWDSETTTTTNDVQIDVLQCSDEVRNECHVMQFPIWCSKGITVLLDAAEGDYVVWYAL